VENKWISSGKLAVEAKIAVTWYLFGRRAEERGACRLVDVVVIYHFAKISRGARRAKLLR
jgi:hypothetical protein